MPRLSKDFLHPLRSVTDEFGKPIKCPKCSYSIAHRIFGGGQTPQGINPHNIELECGRCSKKFYEFYEHHQA